MIHRPQRLRYNWNEVIDHYMPTWFHSGGCSATEMNEIYQHILTDLPTKPAYYQNCYFDCQGKFYRRLPISKHSNRKSVWFELVHKWPDLGRRNVSETLKLRRSSHVLEWRHNERDGVSNHQLHDCLLNSLFKAQIKASIKAPRHWPLCGEFTGDRWIPRTTSQWRGKCFHLMTSSWCLNPIF